MEDSANRMLYVDLTYCCNQSCLFCASGQTNSANASSYHVGEFDQLFDEHRDCSLLHISGGEPTLCEDLIRLCTEARQRFRTILLSSNALKCSDRSYAERLLQTGIDCIIIPFFTSDELVHDYIVGRKGAFGELVSGLQNLIQLHNPRRTTVLLKVIAIRPAMDKLHQLPAFWATSAIIPDEVLISGLHLSGKVLQHPELIPNGNELSVCVSALVESLVDARIPFSICDLPWCLLQRQSLELLLRHGVLRADDGVEYSKVYWRGVRRGSREAYRFPQCADCELDGFCNGYYPANIRLIKDDLVPFLRAIRFSDG